MQWLRRFFNRPERADPNILAMSIPPDRFAALRPDDQFIVSYPRSGNTWMRHLVCEVIVLSQPEKSAPTSLWMLIPDVHVPSHEMQHEAQAEFGIRRRMLKSHHLERIGRHRLLYLFRQPADALVSYYHFYRMQKTIRHQAAEGIDAYCEHMLEGWCAHIELALAYREKAPAETLFISYESLVADGQKALARAVKFLGIEAGTERILEALERNAFSRLREKEAETRVDAEEYFFRKGKVGSAKEELSSATLARINERGGPVYERARQAAESGAALE